MAAPLDRPAGDAPNIQPFYDVADQKQDAAASQNVRRDLNIASKDTIDTATIEQYVGGALDSEDTPAGQPVPKRPRFDAQARKALFTKNTALQKLSQEQLDNFIAQVKPPSLQAALKKLVLEQKLGKMEDVGDGLQIPANLKDMLVAELGGKEFVTLDELPVGFLADPPQGLSPKAAQALRSFIELSAFQGVLSTCAGVKAATLSIKPRAAVATESTPTPDQQNQLIANFLKTGKLLAPAKPDPATSEKFMQLQVASNAVNAIEGQVKGLEAVVKNLPPDDPKGIAFGQFLKMISELLADAKQMIREIQAQEGVRGKKNIQAYKDKMLDKIKKADEERKKAEKARKKAKILGTVFKVLAPILIIVAVVAAIVDGGTLMALLTIAMIAVFTADMASGGKISAGISKGVEALMKVMGSFMQALGMSDNLSKIFAAIVMVVIMVVLVVALKSGAARVASKVGGKLIEKMVTQQAQKMAIKELGEEASKAAIQKFTEQIVAQSGKEMGKTAANQIGKSVALTTGGMFVMTGQVATRVIKDIAVGFGADENNMILEILTQLVNLLIAMLMMGAGMQAGGKVPMNMMKNLGDVGKSIAQKLEMAMGVMEAAQNVYKGVNSINMGILKGQISELQAQIAILDTGMEMLEKERETIREVIDTLNELIELFSQTFDQVLGGQQKALSDLMS